MKKISIIVPVYNAMTTGDGLIVRCVESVLYQRNFPSEDIEVLLVNDGSRDGSLDILREFEKKHPQIIRVIDHENIGVARTRNDAMKLATGEYITFLDQDDWLDDDFLATLYVEAKKTRADVVASGYRRPDKTGRITRTFCLGSAPYSRYTLSAAWAKLHRTEFLRKNDIEFFNNSYGEDLPFSVKENSAAGNYQTIKYVGYNWFFNERSVSNAEQSSLTEDRVKSIERLLKHLCSVAPVTTDRNFNYYLLRTTVFYILFSGRTANRADFLRAKSCFFTILSNQDDMFTRRELHKLLIPPKGEAITVAFVVAAFVLFEKLNLLPVFAILWCRPPRG